MICLMKMPEKKEPTEGNAVFPAWNDEAHSGLAKE